MIARDLIEAWLLTLTGLIIFIVSSAINPAPSLNPIMSAGVWALAVFGFLTSVALWIVAGLAVRAGLKGVRSES